MSGGLLPRLISLLRQSRLLKPCESADASCGRRRHFFGTVMSKWKFFTCYRRKPYQVITTFPNDLASCGCQFSLQFGILHKINKCSRVANNITKVAILLHIYKLFRRNFTSGDKKVTPAVMARVQPVLIIVIQSRLNSLNSLPIVWRASLIFSIVLGDGLR